MLIKYRFYVCKILEQNIDLNKAFKSVKYNQILIFILILILVNVNIIKMSYAVYDILAQYLSIL